MNRPTLVAWVLLLLSPTMMQARGGDWSESLEACKKAIDRGQYREAEVCAAAALQKAMQSGVGEKAIALCLTQQAKALLLQGRYGRVNDVAGRAQVLLEKLHGPEHPDVALCLELRADALCAVGVPDVAFELAHQSGILRQKAFGNKHLELARALETLNRIYQVYGRNGGLGGEEWEQWNSEAGSRALAIRRALLGEDHPDLIPALLAESWPAREWEGRLRQAETLIRKHYGEQHPLLAECLRNLARVDLDKENYQAAETGLLRSLALSRKTLGPDHPCTSATLELLSRVSQLQGQVSRAESLLLESIRCRFRGLSNAELCWFFRITAGWLMEDTPQPPSNPFQKSPPLYEQYLTEMIARRGVTIEASLQRHYDVLSGRYGRAVLFNHLRNSLERLPFASLQELPYAHDYFKSLEALTALRRAQGRPDPVQIVVHGPLVRESVFPDLPEFAVALRNVDSLSQPVGLTDGGDYRSGRLTRWRFQVQGSRGEPLPIVPPISGEGGGIFKRTSLRRGEEWATTLPLGYYVTIPSPGDYTVRVLYHDYRELTECPLLAGLIVCQSPMIRLKVSPRVIEVTTEERTRVKQLLKTLGPKGPVKVVAGGYGPWAHNFVDPTSPPGQILTLGWRAVPVLFDELAQTDLLDKQRAWILALLFGITGANDPRTYPSAVLGDYESHQRPWTVSFGRPGQTASGGAGWSEPESAEGKIDPRKQKDFARRWESWKKFLVVKQPGQEPGKDGAENKTRPSPGTKQIMLPPNTKSPFPDDAKLLKDVWMGPGTNFAHYRLIAAGVLKATKVVLYEGLPHQHWEPELLEQEQKSKKTVQLHNFPFYREPLTLKEEDARKLKEVFCDRGSVSRFTPLKRCGGFHPDYCVEWQDGQDVYRVLLCFGCHELKCYGSKTEVSCDIPEEAYKEFAKILKPYRNNRPQRQKP